MTMDHGLRERKVQFDDDVSLSDGRENIKNLISLFFITLTI